MPPHALRDVDGMSAAQRAQQINRGPAGRYAEQPLTDPGPVVLGGAGAGRPGCLRPFDPRRYLPAGASVAADPTIERYMVDVLTVRDTHPAELPAADRLLQQFMRSHWRAEFDTPEGRAAAHRAAMKTLEAAGCPQQVGDWRMAGEETMPARAHAEKARVRADATLAIAAHQFTRDRWEWAMRCDAKASELELATQSGFSRWLNNRRK